MTLKFNAITSLALIFAGLISLGFVLTEADEKVAETYESLYKWMLNFMNFISSIINPPHVKVEDLNIRQRLINISGKNFKPYDNISIFLKNNSLNCVGINGSCQTDERGEFKCSCLILNEIKKGRYELKALDSTGKEAVTNFDFQEIQETYRSKELFDVTQNILYIVVFGIAVFIIIILYKRRGRNYGETRRRKKDIL